MVQQHANLRERLKSTILNLIPQHIVLSLHLDTGSFQSLDMFF